MDLEVVGRHALFFDDDNSASFVNSPDALVEWNSLSIDRYDVRHLLPVPLPPRTRRRHPHPDASLESDLDLERYRDLPEEKEQEDQDAGNEADVPSTGGFHNVGFAYGDPNESTKQRTTDAEIVFRPAFPVPESLIQNLPSTEKVHQIIARTATFVAKHGGQSEIVLRVKQGDNPMFGFLMPNHNLHAYFRYLVDHQELLELGTPAISVQQEKTDGALDHTGGALSLLGSVYGSGEDEDDTTEEASVLQKLDSPENLGSTSATVHGSEQKESAVIGKNNIISKVPCPPLKEKVNPIKHNCITSTVKGGNAGGVKKESDVPGPLYAAPSKSQASTMPSASKLELPILEPPSDQRRVVEKIVEFILKNGREFEAVLADQNCKQGRFLFLLSSNQYHPYYLKVLQDAQESKLHGNHFISEKQGSSVCAVDKKAAKSSDAISSGSADNEIPFDYDKKEKFKMVIGKSKKDVHDLPSKSNQPEVGFSVDEVASILQAATRGIKKPGLGIFPKLSSGGVAQGSINDGGQDLSSGSQKGYCSSGAGQVSHVPVPVAKAIAETAALAAASEADSSEASLTKEQKLKAERLKRAKVFAAMIKGGSAPMKTDLLRGLSAEPPESGVSSSGNNVSNLATKEREGSSAPVEGALSIKLEECGKLSVDESRLKKSYQTLSKRIEDGKDEEEDKNGHKYHKKRRSRHSSDNGEDRHRHKRRSSSKERDSRHRSRHEFTDSKHRHSRRKHKNDSSDEEHRPSKRHRRHSSSDDDHWVSERHETRREHLASQSRHKHHDSSVERQHSRSRHSHGSSSEDEHRHRRTSLKHRESETDEDLGLEEGEIFLKSDQSLASGGGNASKEASVDITKLNEIERPPSQPSAATVVSDDLRAKIRAMLMATL